MHTLPGAPPPTAPPCLQTADKVAIPPTPASAPTPALPIATTGTPPAPTSLDTLESSVNLQLQAFFAPPPLRQLTTQTPAARFRHSGWWPVRKKVFAAMVRTSQTDNRLKSFDDCGSGSWLQRAKEDANRYRIAANHCHDRLCMPCATARSFEIKRCLMTQMEGKRLSFITLTLKGKGETLRDLVDRLYKHFRALRLHPLWSESVRGGAAFLEVKWNAKIKRWHPHLHIIADADFIDQGRLSESWRSITRDSFIVHLRRVANTDQDAGYVTKYASKPIQRELYHEPDRLDEAIIALKGRRLCLTFGSWYGTPLTTAEDAELADDLIDAGGYENMMPLNSLLEQANEGDSWSIALIRQLGLEAKWLSSLYIDTS